MHHTQPFILIPDYSVNDQTKYSGPYLRLKNLYGNKIINWIKKNLYLKFTPSHMNIVIVETRKAFKMSSISINKDDFNKT